MAQTNFEQRLVRIEAMVSLIVENDKIRDNQLNLLKKIVDKMWDLSAYLPEVHFAKALPPDLLKLLADFEYGRCKEA